MNRTTVITVNGTKKSERGLGLDDGEVSQFTIKPGEYDRNLSGVDDLVAQIEHSAYTRGEWISSLCVNGIDLVERVVSSALRTAILKPRCKISRRWACSVMLTRPNSCRS